LWIDSICIDRENILKRSHYVPFMKSISAQAASVTVWLGQLAGGRGAVMEFLAISSASPLLWKSGSYKNGTRTQGEALLGSLDSHTGERSGSPSGIVCL